jgi:hypothetical protein
MAHEDKTSQYFTRLEQERKSARLPRIVDSRSEGRPYLEPDLGHFTRLSEFTERLAFWRKKRD